MKGLILSGGSGTRLRPITHTRAKQLVPVANRPVLFYAIDAMALAGITDIGIVISPVTGSEIQAAVGNGSSFGVSISWITQDKPKGIAHCLLISRDFLDDDPFVLYLGDNILQQGLQGFVKRFEASRAGYPTGWRENRPTGQQIQQRPAARILFTTVSDPRLFGVAEFDDQGRLVGLVEKPADPPSSLALVGVYLFDRSIHSAVASVRPSKRGELEITDAIEWLIDNGYRVDHEILKGWWIDTGKKDPLLECNRLVLDTIADDVQGKVDTTSRITGRVALHADAELVDSVIEGPAVVGAGTRIVDSHIRPYVSVAEHCEITSSSVGNSVIMAGTKIVDTKHIVDSLIGRHAHIGCGVRNAGAEAGDTNLVVRLMIGDQCQVELGSS
ncbi:MAG: sugar phosphate nucleotidyltransferase [Acidimicrobiaceae bacterium]|nr:sugar phosphate nucleotidyltransferase [Acidimicrobiaceae bacterium]